MDLQRGIGIAVAIAGVALILVPRVTGPALGGWHVAVAIAALAVGGLMIVQSLSTR